MAAGDAFICAICEREVGGSPWGRPGGRDGHLRPVCAACEGSHRQKPVMHAGSFRDRRKARQILALADHLNGTAHTMIWRQRYGRA